MKKWILLTLVFGVVSCAPATTANTPNVTSNLPAATTGTPTGSQLDTVSFAVLDANVHRLLKATDLDTGFVGSPITVGEVPPKLISALNKEGDLAYCDNFARYSNTNSKLTPKRFLSDFQDYIAFRKLGALLIYGEDLKFPNNLKSVEPGQPFLILRGIIGQNLNPDKKNGYIIGITDEKLPYLNFVVCVR